MHPGNNSRSYMNLHMHFVCPCGRELRVKRELAGTEVRCWDCRLMVRVPVLRSRRRLFNGLADGAREALSGHRFTEIAAIAALAAAVLLVPGIAAGLEAVVMMLVAAGYGLI